MSRRVLRLLICTVSVLAVARPAVAQTADPEASRQQNQKRQGEVAAQLDLLKASDVQLKAEASRLEGVVAAHEEAAEAARGEVAKVQDELVGLQVEVGDAEDAAKVQRLRAAERAVAAYMHPGTESVTNVIAARDYDTAHKQRVLLSEVAEHDRQVMQARDDAEQALRSKKDQVEEGHRRIEALRQQREAELAAAQANRDRHAEVLSALEARIADFQHEADSLAAQEANLSAIIAQRAAVAPPVAGAPSSGGSSAGPAELAGAPTTDAPTTTAAPAPTAGRPAAAPTTAAPTTRPAPATTAAPRQAGLSVAWPISGVVTSPFGTRWGRMHQGIDIGAGSGTPIHAAGSGTVFFCGVMDGYGNVALIDHGNGMVTLYAHQSQLACSVGQRVGTGQVIGYVGSTGHSTGPHLHFETRVRGVAVDPMQYLR